MCLEENPATPLMKFRTFRTHCSSIPMFGVVILIFITLCACLSVYTIRTPGNGRPLVSWSTPLTGQPGKSRNNFRHIWHCYLVITGFSFLSFFFLFLGLTLFWVASVCWKCTLLYSETLTTPTVHLKQQFRSAPLPELLNCAGAAILLCTASLQSREVQILFLAWSPMEFQKRRVVASTLFLQGHCFD